MFDKHLADFAELLNRNRRASTLIGLLVLQRRLWR